MCRQKGRHSNEVQRVDINVHNGNVSLLLRIKKKLVAKVPNHDAEKLGRRRQIDSNEYRIRLDENLIILMRT